MLKGVILMSYRFNTRIKKRYEWVSEPEKTFENEYSKYLLTSLNVKVELKNLFIKAEEAFKFAVDLHITIPDDGTGEYEEIKFKVHNCELYIENRFKTKTEEIIYGTLFSESTYERFTEIVESYMSVINRSYKTEMENQLYQVERIVTGIHGLLDDLQFTLELNNLFNIKSTKPQTKATGIDYSHVELEKEGCKLDIKEPICA
ncbi:hypothetical protein [Sporosarcina limicola]|uniref:Uncharacterized protein n=1 Tax=Sporosarcina limicola TaxID=34101 RepID=A0A927MKK3_9BACL|nr:hypothetical protein [Sporosarcina limicola]MBE1556430.1 hypothetical protein [Sporosarcina limicola]